MSAYRAGSAAEPDSQDALLRLLSESGERTTTDDIEVRKVRPQDVRVALVTLRLRSSRDELRRTLAISDAPEAVRASVEGEAAAHGGIWRQGGLGDLTRRLRARLVAEETELRSLGYEVAIESVRWQEETLQRVAYRARGEATEVWLGTVPPRVLAYESTIDRFGRDGGDPALAALFVPLAAVGGGALLAWLVSVLCG